MTRRLRVLDIRDVAERQLCCGCGACAYISPDEIEMVDDVDHGRRPILRNGRPRDPRTAEAMRVCPGVALEHDQALDRTNGLIRELRPAWGPVLEVWEGYASDPEIRFAGSSGGAATALALFCLEKAGMHGVLHSAARADVPYLNDTVLSTHRDELLAATGSRYAPASPCDRLDMIEGAPQPCVFIGKPCDVAAVSKVRRLRQKFNQKLDVNFAVRLGLHDVAGRERLAQYMLRCPFSLERMIRVTEQGKVLYLAENNAPQRFPNPARADLFGGVARNFQVFDPLDFIAEITQHIPEARRHLVRYFGFYSSKTRGLRAKADGALNNTVEIDDNHTPRPRLARRRWAALIQQVWPVDPLVCPRCGHRLLIISFIQPAQRNVIAQILTHCGLSTRAPPSDVRPPPGAPPIRALTYVSDLEFVQDPGPAEPVWSAD